MLNPKKIALSVGAAFALGYAAVGSADVNNTPAAIADSLLKFTNFSFTTGSDPLCSLNPVDNGGLCRVFAVDGGGNPTSYIAIFGGNESASVNGSLGPYPLISNPPTYTISKVKGTSPIGADILGIEDSAGPQAGAFNFGAKHNDQSITNTFIGGISKSVGNSLLSAATVTLQSTGSLALADQDASVTTKQDLTTKFNLVNTDDVDVGLNFDVDRFLRAGLGQPNIGALATAFFQVSVYDLILGATPDTDQLGDLLIAWDPGRSTTATCEDTIFEALGCTVSGNTAITERLNTQRTQDNATGDSVIDQEGLSYGLALTIPEPAAGHAYTFIIAGSVTARAAVVPEPGTVGLLALGLMGLGLGLRRKGVV